MFQTTREELENEIKVQYTARVMPEDQNTGGFYVALIRKNKPTKFPIIEEPIDVAENENETNEEEIRETEEEIKEVEQDIPADVLGLKRNEPSEVPSDVIEPAFQGGDEEKAPKKGTFRLIHEKELVRYEPIPKDIWATIRELYGIGEAFPTHLLTVPSIIGKKIYVVSESIADVLRNDTKKALNTVYFGTSVFVKNKMPTESPDPYRLSHDGIRYIYPFMTKKVVPITKKEFSYLVKKGQTIFHEELKENLPDTYEKFFNLSGGSYCLVWQEDGMEQEELVTIAKMTNSIVVMVPREDINGLRIKYDLY